ncbi:MAG: class II fructose-bisphosphatase [Pseudonocardia sp.]|nr:class II fructose-bisphosphatase [Pseudonocardia sp.]
MVDTGGEQRTRPAPDRNLALELVRVTEAAAMATGRWVGRNDAGGALAAAVHAVRTMIATVEINGTIVIGEGTDDDAVRLERGDAVGDGTGARYDVAVDPVDGITLTAKGLSHAVSVLAVAPSGSMIDPSVCPRIDKLVAGRDARDVVDIRLSVRDNVANLAKATGRHVEDLTIGMLARPHHEELAREVRAAGARIRFLTGGDVAAAIMAASPASGIDMLLGRGGSAEGVIGACAVKCLGGVVQARWWAGDPVAEVQLQTAGVDLDQVLELDDLVHGDDAFLVLTGITDGDLVSGVRYGADTAVTDSIVMRARSGTVRRMRSDHRLDQLADYSSIDYGG